MTAPADELRAAAKVLRETAAVPESSRWIRPGDLAEPYGFAEATEAWIALMSPALAEPLAAWLETCANDLADARHYIDEPNSCDHALAVVRKIRAADARKQGARRAPS